MAPEAGSMVQIGSVVNMKGQVFADHGDGVHPLSVGAPVHQGEVILTKAGSNVEIKFLDDTVLSEGENSNLRLDTYAFDPSKGGSLLFNMAEGAFRVVTGKIADDNPENFKLKSPLATIGIRGTTVVSEIRNGIEKHGAEEIHAGKALTIQNALGQVQLVTNSRGMVDFRSDGSMGAPRPFSVQEIQHFQSVTPIQSVPTFTAPPPPPPSSSGGQQGGSPQQGQSGGQPQDGPQQGPQQGGQGGGQESAGGGTVTGGSGTVAVSTGGDVGLGGGLIGGAFGGGTGGVGGGGALTIGGSGIGGFGTGGAGGLLFVGGGQVFGGGAVSLTGTGTGGTLTGGTGTATGGTGLLFGTDTGTATGGGTTTLPQDLIGGNTSTSGGGSGVATTAGPSDNTDTQDTHGKSLTANTHGQTLTGTAYGDTLTGMGGRSLLQGLGGGDTLIGGSWDHRTMQGDIADYSWKSGGVYANLALGTAVAGDSRDTLENLMGVRGGSGGDTLIGNGHSYLEGGGGDDTLYGANDIDGSGTGSVASYMHASGGVTVVLDAGTTNITDSHGNTASVHYGTSAGADGHDQLFGIHKVIGSAYADVLIGSDSFDNWFQGHGGADSIIGGNGHDDMGNRLIDTISFEDLTAGTVTGGHTLGVTVDLAAQTMTGGDAQVHFSGIEGVDGTTFSDTLIGDSGNNWFMGNGGSDTIIGGGHVGTYDGVGYTHMSGGVTVDLLAGKAVYSGGHDTLTGINQVEGSQHGDTLVGSTTETNWFQGDKGDDLIIGGPQGKSALDTASYEDATDGVTVDLSLSLADTLTYASDGLTLAFNVGDHYGTAMGADGHDTLLSINGVSGSRYADLIIGGAETSFVAANAGDDTVAMGTHFTDLVVIDGGAGTDTLHFTSDGTTTYDLHNVIYVEKVVLGDADTSIDTNMTSGLTGLMTIDASALTGHQLNDPGLPIHALSFDGSGEATMDFSILGGAGADNLTLGQAGNTVNAGAGNDSITYLGSPPDNVGEQVWSGDRINGGADEDTLTYTDTNNSSSSGELNGVSHVERIVIKGMDAYVTPMNTLAPDGGRVTIDGSQLTGGLHFDGSHQTCGLDINGGVGDDFLTGGSATDSIYATSGDDTVYGSTGDDFLSAGGGSNTLDYSGLAQSISLVMTGADAGTLYLSGGAGHQHFGYFTNIIGSDQADSLWGGSGLVTLDGGGGNDTLSSSGSSASLVGGSGDDLFQLGTAMSSGMTIAGGLGDDTLTYFALGAPHMLTDLDHVTGVEHIVLAGGDAYASPASNLTADGGAVTVDGTHLTGGLTFDASHQSSGLVLLGSGQDDAFTFGTLGSSGGAPTINGGAGTDTLTFYGDVMSSANDAALNHTSHVENIIIKGDGGHVTPLADLAPDSGHLTITGMTTGPLVFDGSHQTANLHFTDTTAPSTFIGGSGSDVINLGSMMTPASSVDGGSGHDILNFSLSGGATTDLLDQVSHISEINISGDQASVALTASAGLAEGSSLVIRAEDMLTGHSFSFDASAISSSVAITLIVGSGPGAATLTGHGGENLSVLLGNGVIGYDSVNEYYTLDLDAAHANYTVSGTDATSMASTPGSLHVNAAALGGAALTFDASAINTPANPVNFTLGAGETGSVSILGSAGDDSFSIGTLEAASLTIDGGVGNDTVSLNLHDPSLAFTGVLDGGAGSNTLAVTNDSGMIRTADLTGGTIQDFQTLTFGRDVDLKLSASQFASLTTITGGGVQGSFLDGRDALTIAGDTLTNTIDLNGHTFSNWIWDTSNLIMVDCSGCSGDKTIVGLTAGVTVGSDTIYANELLIGGSGNDSITGNGGDETIYGHGGADTIDALGGTNVIVFDGAADGNPLAGSSIAGTGGANTLLVKSTTDLTNVALSGIGTLTIEGSATATMNADRFAGGGFVTIGHTGYGSSTLHLDAATATTLNLSGFSYAGWDARNTVVVDATGNGSLYSITTAGEVGRSVIYAGTEFTDITAQDLVNEIHTGVGGSSITLNHASVTLSHDVLLGGTGDDFLRVQADHDLTFAADATLDGGDGQNELEFMGGQTDALNVDLSQAHLANFQTMNFIGCTSVTLSTTNVHDLGLTAIGGEGGGYASLLVKGDGATNALDLSGIEWTNWEDNGMVVDCSGCSTGQAIQGANVAETIYGGSGADSILGGSASDTIYHTGGADTVDGGAGDDVIVVGGPRYSNPLGGSLSGGTGNDILLAEGDADLRQTALADFDSLILTGTSHVDVNADQFSGVAAIGSRNSDGVVLTAHTNGHAAVDLSALQSVLGDDAWTSSDSLVIDARGDTTNTSIKTMGFGNVVVYGGPSGTEIFANAVSNVVYAGDGADTVHVGHANDVVHTGLGNDTVVVGDFVSFTSNAVLDGGGGTNTLRGLGNVDLSSATVTNFQNLVFDYDGAEVTLSPSAVSGLHLTISSFKASTDSAQGNMVGIQLGLNDTEVDLSGITIDQDHNQVILSVHCDGPDPFSVIGSSYGDTIYGGMGDDTIDGWGGSDYIYGGEGNDTVRFSSQGPGAGSYIYGAEGENNILDIQCDADFTQSTVSKFATIDIHGGATAGFLASQLASLYSDAHSHALTLTANHDGSDSAATLSITDDVSSLDLRELVTPGADWADGDLVQVHGQTGADAHDATIVGAAFVNNWIYGGDGASNSYTLYGGEGANGITPSNTLVGGAGTDHLHAGYQAHNTVSYELGAGGVTVDLSGAWTFDSDNGEYERTLTGGSAAGDVLYRSSVGDTNSLFDGIIGGSGADTLTAGDWDTTLYGNGGADSLLGGTGNDVFQFNGDADYDLGGVIANGGDGANTLEALGNTDFRNATLSNFSTVLVHAGVTAEFGSSQLAGMHLNLATDAGADRAGAVLKVWAEQFSVDLNDMVTAGSNWSDLDSITLHGVSTGGYDLTGLDGANNWIFGGSEDAVYELRGGAGGSNTLVGGPGTVHMYAGAGAHNTVCYEADQFGVTVDLSDSLHPTLAGGSASNDTLIAESGAIFDGIIGSDYADSLIGGTENDTIYGHGGADTIDGGAGNNVIQFSGDANGVFADGGTGGANTLEVLTSTNFRPIISLTHFNTLLLHGASEASFFASQLAAAGITTVDHTGGSGATLHVFGDSSGSINLSTLAVGAGWSASADRALIDASTSTTTIATLKNAGHSEVTGGVSTTRIDAFDKFNIVHAGVANTTIAFSHAHDVIYGEGGNDTLNLAGGSLSLSSDAIIDGGAGSDIFRVMQADGGASRSVDATQATIANIEEIHLGAKVTLNLTASQAAALAKNYASDDGYSTLCIHGDDLTTTLDLSGATLDNWHSSDLIVIDSSGCQLPQYLTGTQGNESITGGNNNDTIYGHGGADTMDGGAGNDVFLFNGSADGDPMSGVSINGGDGTNTLRILGSTDFTQATFTHISALEFAAGASATLTQTQLFGDHGDITGMHAVHFSDAGADTLVLNADGTNHNIGMSGINISNWHTNDVLKIDCTTDTAAAEGYTIHGSGHFEILLGGDHDDTVEMLSGLSDGGRMSSSVTIDGGGGTNSLFFIQDHNHEGYIHDLDHVTNIQTIVLSDADTSITAKSGAMSGGHGLTVDATSLGTGDHPHGLFWDGSASTDDLTIQAGNGHDTLIGGQGHNEFDLGTHLDSGDHITGTGTDNTLRFTQQTGSGVTYDSHCLDAAHNIQHLVLEGYAADLVAPSGLSGGASLSVDGHALTDGLTWDGSALSVGQDITGTQASGKLNVLTGGSGADHLTGGISGDILLGGAGADTLTGNGGTDIFHFTSATDLNAGKTITDFTGHVGGPTGRDLLSFDQTGFGFSYSGALHTDSFFDPTGYASSSGSSACFIYDQATGVLQYDSDGHGGANEAKTVATLTSPDHTSHPDLNNADIIIATGITELMEIAHPC
jgi:Ca2+-binding RTX toxin-like protein